MARASHAHLCVASPAAVAGTIAVATHDAYSIVRARAADTTAAKSRLRLRIPAGANFRRRRGVARPCAGTRVERRAEEGGGIPSKVHMRWLRMFAAAQPPGRPHKAACAWRAQWLLQFAGAVRALPCPQNQGATEAIACLALRPRGGGARSCSCECEHRGHRGRCGRCGRCCGGACVHGFNHHR